MAFKIKRAYEPASSSDGARILVDRLWPRGVKKTSAHLCCWMKDIAPSPKLRTWFGHRPERFVEFRGRYERELSRNALMSRLREFGGGKLVTLVYGAQDPLINHARVLLDVLRRESPTSVARRPRTRARTSDYIVEHKGRIAKRHS